VGVAVHLHVAFSSPGNEGVARLATSHLERLITPMIGVNYNSSTEILQFLESLSVRTGGKPWIKRRPHSLGYCWRLDGCQ
jgi:hypothetical protein